MAGRWSDKEVEVLYDKWPYNTSKQISRKFIDRSPKAIREKAYREGIETEEHSMVAQMKEKPDGVVIGDDVSWEELDPTTRHYYRNKGSGVVSKIRESTDRRTASLRNWVDEIKGKTGCNICNEDCPCALVFHHLDEYEKENSVSKMVSLGRPPEVIKREIEKCSVLCANCHRKHHSGIINPEDLSEVSVNIEYELGFGGV